MAYPWDMNDAYGQPGGYGGYGGYGGSTAGGGAADSLSPLLASALMGGQFGLAEAGVDLLGQLLGGRNQARTAREQMANQLAVANINTAPALGTLALNQQRFGRGNELLNALLAGSPTGAAARRDRNNLMRTQLAGLFGDDSGISADNLAQQASWNQPDLLSALQGGGQSFFQGMPQPLFQQQLNQILGGASSALGGQLVGANAGMAGAGMAPGSPVGQGIQRQFANQALSGAQNAMTGAYVNKYGQDFQRQQAQAGYNTQLANLGLGQRQQQQQFGLGLGELGLGQQQQRLNQRGQRLGLLGQLLA